MDGLFIIVAAQLNLWYVHFYICIVFIKGNAQTNF